MISRADVEHVAELARLHLTDEELDRMQGQLSRILEAIAVVRDDAADAARAAGDRRPLLGIPYALKDIFVTRALDDDGRADGGLPTTAGSRILAGYLSHYASDA